MTGESLLSRSDDRRTSVSTPSPATTPLLAVPSISHTFKTTAHYCGGARHPLTLCSRNILDVSVLEDCGEGEKALARREGVV